MKYVVDIYLLNSWPLSMKAEMEEEAWMFENRIQIFSGLLKEKTNARFVRLDYDEYTNDSGSEYYCDVAHWRVECAEPIKVNAFLGILEAIGFQEGIYKVIFAEDEMQSYFCTPGKGGDRMKSSSLYL